MPEIDRREATEIATGGFIDASEAVTLWGLFEARVRRSAGHVAYRDYDPLTKNWRDHTWRAMAARVERFRAAFAQEKLKAGDRVAVLLPNGIDWVCFDLAAHASGLVVVGLYPHDSAANNAFILGHSDARVVLLDTEARWRSLGPLRAEFPLLERVWIRNKGAYSMAPEHAPFVCELAYVLANASDLTAAHQAEPSDLATLIYTSGTTGRPKGVMLSHFALLWNAQASAAIVPPRPDDVFLSVLPLAHAFERTIGYYLPLMGGSTVAYARAAQHLQRDLLAIHPTAILGVPLLYERMSDAIHKNVAASFAKRKLLQIAAFFGWRLFTAAQRQETPDFATRVLWPMLKRHVASPVLAAFGGRLRVAVSGGASLNPSVARQLIGLGLPLVEGYGLTEAAPVIAANALDDNMPGSVGRPLPGIEVKLTGDKELLVRSPSVMRGYWKDDTDTARVLDDTGWLSTGDVAELRDGRIFVRGRRGETIVLSIGEKVNPNVVEAALTRDPLFEQSMVVGGARPYLVAIIVLNGAVWEDFAASRGLDPDQPNCAEARTEILSRITPLLTALPRFAQIRAVHLTREPWTIEAGLLTPTLKIKRDAIQRIFAKEIDELYTRR